MVCINIVSYGSMQDCFYLNSVFPGGHLCQKVYDCLILHNRLYCEVLFYLSRIDTFTSHFVISTQAHHVSKSTICVQGNVFACPSLAKWMGSCRNQFTAINKSSGYLVPDERHIWQHCCEMDEQLFKSIYSYTLVKIPFMYVVPNEINIWQYCSSS